MKSPHLVISISVLLASCGEINTDNITHSNENQKNIMIKTIDNSSHRNLKDKNHKITNIPVMNNEHKKINNFIQQKYSSITINKITLELENTTYNIIYDISSGIYETGEEGSSSYNSTLAYVQESIHYFVNTKLDPDIININFIYTIEGENN